MSTDEEDNPDKKTCFCCDLMCCFGCLAICGCRKRLARRLLFLAPPVMYCVVDGDELLKSREPIRPISSYQHMTNSGEKQLPEKRSWRPKPRGVVMNLTPDDDNEIEMKEVAGEDMFKNKVSDPIPRKSAGQLEVKIKLTTQDLIDRGGVIEDTYAEMTGTIKFSKHDRRRNAFPPQCKAKSCLSKHLITRMASEGNIPLPVDRLMILKSSEENREVKTKEDVTMMDSVVSTVDKATLPPKTLIEHCVEAHDVQCLREVYSEERKHWFVGQVLHLAIIGGETWYFIEWEDMHTNKAALTMVHREYIFEDAEYMRPLQHSLFCVLDWQNQPIYPILAEEHVRVTRRAGGRDVFAVFVTPPEGKSEVTIIHSHGNGSDLGVMVPWYLDLASNLGVNLIGYDYTGYGLSGQYGTASEEATYDDIEAVWIYATEEIGVNQRDTILYGQSMGTGPTTRLAARLTREREDFAGIVLHAPLASALRVVTRVQKTAWFDMYPNIDVITDVCSNIFILHGSEDDVIDKSHGQAIAHNASHYTRSRVVHWFPEEASHNDIEIKFRVQYLMRLRNFIKLCVSSPSAENAGPVMI